MRLPKAGEGGWLGQAAAEASQAGLHAAGSVLSAAIGSWLPRATPMLVHQAGHNKLAGLAPLLGVKFG